MTKSVALTNQKLVERLRSEDDLDAVQSALDRGEITPRQAQNITKMITAARSIRENYPYAAVVFDEASGQYVGEVVSQNRGASWIGRRYGRDFPHDSAEFTEQDDAVRFVRQAPETGSKDPGVRKLSTGDDEFTPEQLERIRAHIKARGMTFEVFLPESLADWLRQKITAGVFKDAKEAAFVAFQDLQELDRHPEVREQLLHAMLESSLKDPRPRIPLEDVRARHRTQLREWANTDPPAT